MLHILNTALFFVTLLSIFGACFVAGVAAAAASDGELGWAVAAAVAALFLGVLSIAVVAGMTEVSASIAENKCEKTVEATGRPGHFFRIDHWNWDCLFDDGITLDQFNGRLELDILEGNK